MGLFGRIFGTDKAIDNIVDSEKGLLVKAGTALGNLHYSDQEKAQDAAGTREWGIRMLDALAPFKVVQRIIAFTAMFVWCVGAFNGFFALWYDVINACPPEAVNCVEPQAFNSVIKFIFSDYIFWPVLAVLGLYMTGGVIPTFGRK